MDRILLESNVDLYVKKICGTGITPNMVTLAGLPVVYLMYNAMLRGDIWTGLFWLIVRTYLDVLDGKLARCCNMVSTIGSRLDTFVDLVYIVFFAYGVIGNCFPQYHTYPVLLVLGGAFLTLFYTNMDFDNHEMSNELGEWTRSNTIVTSIILWLVWVALKN